jgi:hypothetical protein
MKKERAFRDLPHARAELVAKREAALRDGPPLHLREALEGVLGHLPADAVHVALSAWRAASAAFDDDAKLIERRKAVEKQRRAIALICAELMVVSGHADLAERDKMLDQVMAAQAANRWDARTDNIVDQAAAISAATPTYMAAFDHAVRRRELTPPPPLAEALDAPPLTEALDALKRADKFFEMIANGLRGAGPPVSRLAHFGRVLFPWWVELHRRESKTPARDLRVFLSSMAEIAAGSEPIERLVDTVGDQLRRSARRSSHN